MFDFNYIVRQPVLLATFAIAVPAWIIAFIAQAIAEARYGYNDTNLPVCRFLWFSIWVELAIIGHFMLAVGNNALHIHRLQIAIVLAVALVFSVFGCEFLFDSRGALIAVGVAWLLLTLVNLVWILYLTSEEESPFYRFLYAGGPRRTRTETYTEQPYPAFSGYAPTATDATPQKVREIREPTPQPSILRAKAMYAYSADPSDSNEVSFAKGDILEVLDNSGKWWQVKTPSGAVGIAPSNYCSLLDAA